MKNRFTKINDGYHDDINPIIKVDINTYKISETEKTNGYASITKLPGPMLIKPNFCCKAPKTKLNIRPIVIPKSIFKMLLMKKIN